VQSAPGKHRQGRICFANLPDFIDSANLTARLQGHCQNISGKGSGTGTLSGNFVLGTRYTERTGYLRFFFFLPVKVIIESIATNLKRSKVAMMMFMA